MAELEKGITIELNRNADETIEKLERIKQLLLEIKDLTESIFQQPTKFTSDDFIQSINKITCPILATAIRDISSKSQ